MTAYPLEDVRSLRVGERIHIIGMPIGCDEPTYTFYPDTRRLFRYLIERKRPVVVESIDEHGYPWIRCQYRYRGRMGYHQLALSEVDQWVRVRSRS